MCYNIEQLEKKAEKRATRDIGALLQPFGQTKMDFHSVSGFLHPPLLLVTADEPKVLQRYRWGLIPSWVKDEEKANDLSKYTLNAKSETIFEKPSFKTISKKRCLIPIEGFFEWMEFQKKKYPHFIYREDKETFYLGGIYDSWVNKDSGEIINSFSIITTEANKLLAKIHNNKKRMPFIVPNDSLEKWIDPKLTKAGINDLMKPLPDGELTAHTISGIITGRGERNVPEVIEPFEYPELL